MATLAQQKALGAFYTSEPVARYLVRWAVRSKTDKVLDPSCGPGVFLSAAAARLRELGNDQPEICGIDIDPEALRYARSLVPSAKLVDDNFFNIRTGELSTFTAIVGNPPFIRYQSFNGSQRSAALARAREAGIELPQLSSSWAPFLIHASEFLQIGGRLAMVAPAELIHAKYAAGVIRLLTQKFERITVRLFQHKLFPELNEDTLLLLCEGYGHACQWFGVSPTHSIHRIGETEAISIPVDIEGVRSGHIRLTRYLLTPKARHLYENLSQREHVLRLGEAADIGIGYVTGANDFFHLTYPEACKFQVSARFLKKALVSLGAHKGCAFDPNDWSVLKKRGHKVYLLALPTCGKEKFPRSVRDYIRLGEQIGVSQRFKCRVRSPWYSVPHVRIGDAFLSYMSGEGPKLVTNSARVVAPNTLHILRFFRARDLQGAVIGWNSSLTKLSCELEGHALGGGMLKLEPSEAERIRIALPIKSDLQTLRTEIEDRLDASDIAPAIELADRYILRRRFGLSLNECLTLRQAAEQLAAWRMHR
jgi:adenine-specific DNA methylase